MAHCFRNGSGANTQDSATRSLSTKYLSPLLVSVTTCGGQWIKTVKRFFRRLLRPHGKSPWKIVTDKLRSYGAARRELMPATIHDTDRHANNRAEPSHQPTRARVRGMRRLGSPDQAQRFSSAHAVVYSLFNLQRWLVSAAFYRFRRARAFECRNEAVAARGWRTASARPTPLTCQYLRPRNPCDRPNSSACVRSSLTSAKRSSARSRSSVHMGAD